MPLTDKEREDLKKLTPDELIELYGTERDNAEANAKEAREERAGIMRAFLTGKGADTKSESKDGGKDNGEEYNEENDAVLKKLENKFKGR